MSWALFVWSILCVCCIIPRAASNDVVDYILEVHEQYRSVYGLRSVQWDNNVARTAQNWANKCTMSHGSRFGVAENIYQGHGGWEGAFRAWVNSKKGHFENMKSTRASRVGCGVAQCKGGYIFVCRYS